MAVKQSDKHKFSSEEKFNNFRRLLRPYSELFDLDFEKNEDITVSLEKLLQVLLAFEQGGYHAYTKKSQVLKVDSKINKDIVSFIQSDKYTINDIINIYLTFLKAEKLRKESEDKRTPIPTYLISFLGERFKNITPEKCKGILNKMFDDKNKFTIVFNFYKAVTKKYTIRFRKDKGIEYNQMIKTPIDTSIFYSVCEEQLEETENIEIKETVILFHNLFK